MSESRSRGIMGILLMVLVFFIILVVFAFYTVGVFKKNTFQDNFSNKGGSIAVVEINGVIMDSKKTIEKLHIAEKDKKYDAIIVRINSPGGAVGPSQEIYHEIRRIDQDKKSGKPVYASFGSIAASGGYYIGAAGRKIFSNSGCLTGSIGVILQTAELTSLLEKVGIQPIVIKSGQLKAVPNPLENVDEENLSYMKKIIDRLQKEFIELVEKKEI